jgi:DNA-binding transcriptional LysR family regulator
MTTSIIPADAVSPLRQRLGAAADGYDAVVRHAPIEDTRLTARRLAPNRRLLVAAPSYVAERGMPTSLADLANHLEVFTKSRYGQLTLRRDYGGRRRLCREGQGRTAHQQRRRHARCGESGALLPTFIVGDALSRGKLRVIDVGTRSHEESICVAHPEGRRPAAKLKALVEHLATASGDPHYWYQDL